LEKIGITHKVHVVALFLIADVEAVIVEVLEVEGRVVADLYDERRDT
jgi:hypothetical protein